MSAKIIRFPHRPEPGILSDPPRCFGDDFRSDDNVARICFAAMGVDNPDWFAKRFLEEAAKQRQMLLPEWVFCSAAAFYNPRPALAAGGNVRPPLSTGEINHPSLWDSDPTCDQGLP
jgi:hypothetical protein